MKTYIVKFEFKGTLIFRVKANSLEEAIQISRSNDSSDENELEQLEQESHSLGRVLSVEEKDDGR